MFNENFKFLINKYKNYLEKLERKKKVDFPGHIRKKKKDP